MRSILITRKEPDLLQKIEAALQGGIDAIQLRDHTSDSKDLFLLAKQLRNTTWRYRAKLFINSRADIAIAVNADGVHFPENSQVQKWPNLQIGVSVHSLEAAKKAERDGADFLFYSPIFESPDKSMPVGLESLKNLSSKTSLPVYALGGVTADKIPAILETGAYGAATISAIFDAADPLTAALAFTAHLKKQKFRFQGIYGIVSTLDAGIQAIESKVGALQFRWKGPFTSEKYSEAAHLSSLCHDANIPFLINDRADIAKALNASGVHLGQSDLPLKEARKILGPEKIIGVTASNLQEAAAAEKEGADYIGLGHVFSTKSKEKSYPPIGLRIVRQVKERLSIPLIAIGGIDETNADSVFAAGADGIAVLSGLPKILSSLKESSTHSCKKTNESVDRQGCEFFSKNSNSGVANRPWPDEEIFSSQISLPEIGIKGQRRLQESSILVVGLGGLGSACLSYLAASGIGRIGLLDFDRVEPSNLPRQILYGEADVGKWKAEAAHRHLSRQYPTSNFESHILSVEQADLRPYDMILDATDRASARYWINDACQDLRKPWIYGSIHEWQGQAALFDSHSSNYRILFPDASSSPLPSCAQGGVLGPLAGCIGSIQALEAIRFLATGESPLMNQLLVLDARHWRFQLFKLHNSLQQNVDIDSQHLKLLLEQDECYLVDATRPYSIDELPKNRKIIFYCTSGIRSAAAAKRLRQEGFDAYSLAKNL